MLFGVLFLQQRRLPVVLRETLLEFFFHKCMSRLPDLHFLSKDAQTFHKVVKSAFNAVNIDSKAIMRHREFGKLARPERLGF